MISAAPAGTLAVGPDARPASRPLHPAIAAQCAWRYAHPSTVGIKVNLYREAEVAGLAQALGGEGLSDCPLECVMVGDSFFMTHLGRPSTRLAGEEEQRWGFETMVGLVAEVREALELLLPPHRLPYLIGDLPDGCTEDPATTLARAERYLAAGADVIKVEAGTPAALACVEAAASAGIPTIVHMGYTPQTGAVARYGNTLPEALGVFAAARRARDSGACAIVLEMVSEAVNRSLSAPNPAGLPVYSIFSGRAPYGGQSLNAWDATFRPRAPRRYFPPTAVLDPDADRGAYGPEILGECLGALLRLTLAGSFPLTPPPAMSPADEEILAGTDPWCAQP